MSVHQFDLAVIGSGLPVSERSAELEHAATSGAVVVTAPPGTGKTTLVPPLVANVLAAQGSSGTVLLTQPRRVAVRAAARRLAALDGSSVGGPVGFTVRGERHVGAATRIEAVTPGVLLRRLLHDPGLDGVGAVILDEVHERSVDSDLLLGMLAELRQLRPELIVVAMSATLDAAGTAAVLNAALVHVPARTFPLEVAYAPGAQPRLEVRGVSRAFLAHIAHVAVTEQAAAGCDALVFLPGAREVDEVVRLIQSELAAEPRQPAPRPEVLPLHGRLPSREQDRAVSGRSPGESPRIVVSTALAESSLTVPGVRLVIDAGLSREVRRDRGRDMTGLVTVSASRASAEQRAGRAARLGPGRTVRAYSETEFARMPEAAPPEILAADLTDAALILAAWGTPGGVGLPLLTPPPEAAMAAATSQLESLSLTGSDGLPTALGRRVSQLPIGVREARALISGAAWLNNPTLSAEVVAALSDDFRAPHADLSQLVRELRTGRAAGADRWRRERTRLARLAAHETDAWTDALPPAGALQPATADHSGAQVSDAPQLHASPLTGDSAPGDSTRGDSARGDSARTESVSADSAEAVGIVTALARPEWIARRTAAQSRSYLLASGTRAAVPAGSPLFAHEWLAVREVQRVEGPAGDGTGAVIRLAAPLHEDQAQSIGQALLTAERSARVTDGRVRVQERRLLGAILLTQRAVAAQPEDLGPAFAAQLRTAGLTALTWGEGAVALRGRLALLHREIGEPWPDVREEALLTNLDAWLGPDLAALSPRASLHSIDVTAALRRLLPWPEAGHLDALAPEHLAVPSGSRVRIAYPAADDPAARPVVAVKLQELFGFAQTPRLANGRVPILFHLLSPARKPLAVTDDLESFWNGPYQDVRREMRGRYPKHPWPEDPWSAVATARTTRAQAARDPR